MNMQIDYETERELGIDYEALAVKVADKVLEMEKCPYEAQVNLVLTDNDEIKRVNTEFRDIERATDVLSFPMIPFEVPAGYDIVEEDESYFDLDTDYETYMNAANPRDKYLGAAIKAGDGIRILRQDLWEMIVTFLISQQNNIKRIRKCIETICRKYGERKVSPMGVEYYAFPTVEALSQVTEEDLRGCGLG